MPLNILTTAVKDDQPILITRRDFSGGANNRVDASNIKENQVSLLRNADIEIPGQLKKRPGLTLVEDLASEGLGLYGFEPSGTNLLCAIEGSSLYTWSGAGSFSAHDTGFTTGQKSVLFKVFKSGGAGEVIMIQNGTENAHELSPAYAVTDLGADANDPPKTLANAWFRGRWWALKNNYLYYSDAYPSAYASAFNQATNAYIIPVGVERAIVGVPDMGLISFGQDSIYGINPTVTPAATDKSEKLLDIGCAEGQTVCRVGDEIFFLAYDGVRALFRTMQDKIQLKQSYPISYPLKTEFDDINWSAISKASAVYFDNKYFISLPTDSSSTPNQVWVYYPAHQSWTVITGWSVTRWAVMTVSGKQKLYCIDADGIVYEAWSGYSDNSVAIDLQLEGRKEDLGVPHVDKYGGELKIRVKSTGGYTINVYASFDGKGYTLLGTMDLGQDLITFPVTFPVNFGSIRSETEGTFHLDGYGKWRNIKIKVQHNATNASDDIVIYEYLVASYPEGYLTE